MSKKKITSFSLDTVIIKRIHQYATALGLSDSEFLDTYIKNYKWSPEVEQLIKEISALQEKLRQLLKMS